MSRNAPTRLKLIFWVFGGQKMGDCLQNEQSAWVRGDVFTSGQAVAYEALKWTKQKRGIGVSQEETRTPLEILGTQSDQPASPDEAKLETVPNPHPDLDYVTRFTCPEFTSICPVTGQPDFAHLVIDYIPDQRLVESKSLKLFMGSFRNHGAFHEDCTILIAKRLVDVLSPRWLRIAGYWYPRGGIPIDVFFQSGEPPKDVWIPDTGVQAYRGRG